MPFGFEDDYDLNPHLAHGGAATALPHDQFRLDKSDGIGPVIIGLDRFAGHTGLWIEAPVIPIGKFHRFRMGDTDPRKVEFCYTSEATSLIAWIAPPFYPERPFNQGNVGRIFVFGVHLMTPGPHPWGDLPIRGTPTPYGWFIEVDSEANGRWDTVVYFFRGP